MVKVMQNLDSKQNGLLSGKRGLITGVANDMSLAWGIAQECHRQGAELAFTYMSEAFLKRLKPLAESLNSDLLLPCNAVNEEDLAKTFAELEQKWGKIDFIVHSIAFADKSELRGRFVNTNQENFLNSMNISCYTLTAMARHALPLLKEGGSIITLTYYGAEKAIPNYNLMGVAKAALEASVRYLAMDLGQDGIRVNALSAGPVRTLATTAIGDFKSMLDYSRENTPLRRNTSLEDVGRTAVYLLSDLSSGVTGEVIHVDSGYHAVGMPLKVND
jgi:enoyl-[acyl-carrier protein] reductase I